MTTLARTGFNVQFKYGNGASPESFLAVNGLTDIKGPETSRETPEVTSKDSPSGFKQFIGGLKDAGEVTISMRFLPSDATQQALMAQLETDTPNNYKIIFSDYGSPPIEWPFSGLVTKFGPTEPLGDTMNAECTIKVNGVPGW